MPVPPVPDHWTLPSPDELDLATSEASMTQRSWLLACQAQAALRVPPSVFETIPGDLWEMLPWGHRCVVVRCPPTSKIGSIHVPESDRRATTAGWVLTVSPEINRPDGRLPYWYPFHPLTFPGELVTFARWAGQTLPIVGARYAQEPPYVILNIADIFAPIFSKNEEYWTGVVKVS